MNIKPIPVTNITRNTAKAMLPPSYHPSFTPCEKIEKETSQNNQKAKTIIGFIE